MADAPDPRPAHVVLGLPGPTADRAAIRRAYAAALRVHPPDTDPDGFRRVRDAYVALLGDAEARADRAGAGRAGARDVRSPAPDRRPATRAGAGAGADDAPTRAAWARALDDARFLPTGPRQDEARLAALADGAAAAGDDPGAWAAWEAEAAAVLSVAPRLAAAVLTPSRVVALARAEVAGVARGAPTLLAQAGLLARVEELGRALLDAADAGVHGPTATLTMLAVAERVGVRAPDLGRRLLDRAWDLTPPDRRAALPAAIGDAATWVGAEWAGRDAAARDLVARLPALAPSEVDAAPPGLVARVREAAAELGPRSATVAWLTAFAPAFVPDPGDTPPMAAARPRRSLAALLAMLAVCVGTTVGGSLLRHAATRAPEPGLPVDDDPERTAEERRRDIRAWLGVGTPLGTVPALDDDPERSAGEPGTRLRAWLEDEARRGAEPVPPAERPATGPGAPSPEELWRAHEAARRTAAERDAAAPPPAAR